MKRSVGGSERFRRFAHRTADLMGMHYAFVTAFALVLVWLITGPLFHFSETWQLIINTATTIVTFLMIFLVQATQNRDAKAVHLKLDELIRATHARNRFAALEDATEEELCHLQEEFRKLAHAKSTARKVKKSG